MIDVQTPYFILNYDAYHFARASSNDEIIEWCT